MSQSITPPSPEPSDSRSHSSDSRSLVSWSDVSAAIDELIDASRRELVCFDENLTLQGWESKARIDRLHDAIVLRGVNVRIALLDTTNLSSRLPRLMALLRTHGHKLRVLRSQARPKPDAAIVVADRQHSLFRPVLVQSRGFLYIENPGNSKTYHDKFEVIWQQGGTPVFPEAFGL